MTNIAAGCDMLTDGMKGAHPLRRLSKLAGITAALLLAGPGIAAAQSFGIESFIAQVGQTLIVNSYTEDSEGNPVQGSDVSPLRLTIGGGARFTLTGPWHAGVLIHLWTQEYLQTPEGPVVPTQIETGAAAGESLAATLGFMLSLPFSYDWAPEATPEFRFGGGLSPTLVFRIPYAGIDGSEPDGVRSYYLSSLRFLYPETFVYTDYLFTERLSLTLHLRALWPLYNLWDGEATPFLDETLVSFLF
ncbi:MAG: hypothetical protein ACOC28_07095, partial [Alkalispirochaetaceae bacterium]